MIMMLPVGVINHKYPEDGEATFQDIGASKDPQSDCSGRPRRPPVRLPGPTRHPACSPSSCSSRTAARSQPLLRSDTDKTPTRRPYPTLLENSGAL